MTTLARELQSRNHDVVFISLPDGEPSVRAAGLTFLPCGAQEFPAGSVKERLRRLSKLQGDEALRVTATECCPQDRSDVEFITRGVS